MSCKDRGWAGWGGGGSSVHVNLAGGWVGWGWGSGGGGGGGGGIRSRLNLWVQVPIVSPRCCFNTQLSRYQFKEKNAWHGQQKIEHHIFPWFVTTFTDFRLWYYLLLSTLTRVIFIVTSLVAVIQIVIQFRNIFTKLYFDLYHTWVSIFWHLDMVVIIFFYNIF